MAIFLPALIVLGGAAAALFAPGCAPSKDPDSPDAEDPENDDPSATPFNSIDSTPSDTYSDDSETPASSTATGTPWPPSTAPYFTPTPALTPEPTDDEVQTPTITPLPEPDPTPSDFVMQPGEFTMVFHLILPDTPNEAIIPMNSYLDGITRATDSELRAATAGKYGVAYYPDEDPDDPTDPSNRVVVDEIYSTALYDQTLELSNFRAMYEAEMGKGTYDERFGDNAIHVIIAPNTYSGAGQASLGYPMVLLNYNLEGVIASMKTAIHEIGHGYGQNHPHEGDSSNDPVDRTSELVTREDGKKNCDQDDDGDGICDTEADPGINQGCNEINLATCKVQCTEPETGDPMVDANGDEYDPDTSLVMSYYTDDCAYAFSGEESTGIKTTAESLDTAFVANGGHYAPPSSLRRLAPPAVITVDPLGVAPAYTTVNSAVRAGRDGVKIYLTPWTYYENVFWAGTHVFIFGQGSILDGMDAGPAIEGVSASLSIEDLTIRGGYNPDGCGGGISITDDGANSGDVLLSLEGSVVEKNVAKLGAGICASHGGRVEIVSSMIQNNRASSEGGGIRTYNVGESSVIEGSTIRDNISEGVWGGGISIYQQYSPLALRSTLIENNNGKYYGGGLQAQDANVVFEDVECVGNTAQHNGGCFYLAGAGLTVYSSTIYGNDASSGPEGYADFNYYGIPSIFATDTNVLWESETYKSEGPNFQMWTNQGTQPKTPLLSGVAYYCDTEVGSCVDQSTGQTVAKTRPPVQVMPAPIEVDNTKFRSDDTVPISALPDRLRRIMESVSTVSK